MAFATQGRERPGRERQGVDGSDGGVGLLHRAGKALRWRRRLFRVDCSTFKENVN